MGIVSEDTFVRAMSRDRRLATQAVNIQGWLPYPADVARVTVQNIQVDRDSALRVYAAVKDYIIAQGYLPGKYLRPWELDDQLYARLDRTKPWWGFEFETGYKSHEARAAVINHVWDTWNNVVFDSEGEGNAAVEITFAPQESYKFLDGTADAYKFIEYLTNNPRVMKGAGSAVGTHLNFSHPDLSNQNIRNVVFGLQRTVAVLPNTCKEGNTRMYMFGRERLYGGFFSNAIGDSCWIEGKLFRTTYDINTFKRYIQVAEGLTKCLTVLCNTANAGGKIPYVTNLYDVTFTGAEPNIGYAMALEIDGTRGNGLLNGPLAVDENPEGILSNRIPVEEDDEDDDDERIWCDDCNDYH